MCVASRRIGADDAVVGMMLAVFLVALDQTIIAPALPVIASKFEALDELAWVRPSILRARSDLSDLQQLLPDPGDIHAALRSIAESL